MTFGWLKRMMPRGLYGRAALILILPIFSLQLVVSVVFLQRHFEGVTRQMTAVMLREMRFLDTVVQKADTPGEARIRLRAVADPLNLGVALAGDAPPPPEGPDPRAFYDFSGRVVIATLRGGLGGVSRVDLSDERRVRLWIETRHGPMFVTFPRARVSASNPHQLLVLMVFTGLLMTVIAYLFLRNQLRPIRRLARAAQDYGRGRVVPYRPAGATEVRAAGAAFVEMRGRIERQSEQRRLMLSGISHDLRTPLTRIRLGLSMLPGDEDVAALEKDVDEMGRMIDAFLAFARDDNADEPALDVVPAEWLGGIVEDARRAGQAVRLIVEPGAADGDLVALRPQALRRAVENLLGNAVRYGTQAEVTLTVGARMLKIAVEDDGPGIPPERREEALRPFTRLDPARNQNRGQGVGLGLAIAAEILRSHGGTLRLTEGLRLRGLRVELTLPR